MLALTLLAGVVSSLDEDDVDIHVDKDEERDEDEVVE